MALLCLIAQRETYGYEILTKPNESAQVLGYAREGTVYPILYRLEEAWLIASRRAPGRANGGSKKAFFAHTAGAGGAGRNEKLLAQVCLLRGRIYCLTGKSANKESIGE